MSEHARPEHRVCELLIVRVTAYEDRAEVVREAQVELLGGRETLLLEGLTPLVSQDRVVATLRRLEDPAETTTQAETVTNIDDVRVEHRWIETRGDEVGLDRELENAAWLKDVEDRARQAHKNLRAAEEAVARLLEQRQALASMVTRYGTEIGGVLTRGLPVKAGALEEGLKAFEAAAAPLGPELAKARADADQALRRVESLEILVIRNQNREMRYISEVWLTVSGEPGPARLTVSTVIPCGLWRPSHEAHLARDGEVDWSTHATVWQKTGEDWNDVELTLSTARPSAGAKLPSLKPDVLRLREKTKEEKKKIHVEHRHEEVPRADLAGAAPGVYDGGVARELRPAGRVTIPSDGRPHRVAVGSFTSAARVEKVAIPELSPHVFHRATLHNRGGAPLLAGPVTLISKGSWVGIGDLSYVADGEEFDLSLGSDDLFTVGLRRRRIEEERKLLKDRVHFVTEVDIAYSGVGEEEVAVLLRLPKSELGQLRVVASEAYCDPWPVPSDEHGLVRVPVRPRAGALKTVKLGFHFETSGDVVVPDPW